MDRSLAEKAADVATLLAALANEKRLLVLCLLLGGELSVTTLADEVGLSQSAMSQHLAKMRALGLVAGRRDAQTIYYHIASDELRQVMRTLAEIYCPPDPAVASGNS
ncbi:DNA-binding transcriptional ArsR family regulator [Amorphus suaedae]